MYKFELCAFADEASKSVSEQIEAMASNGIKYLEARGIDGENISDISIERAKQLKEELAAHGLAVWSLGSPIGKIDITDDFAPHMEKFRHTLELARKLGAKQIRLFSFYIPDGEYEKYRDEVFSRLSAFVSAAEGSSVTLCHENEKGIYGDIPERCFEIHQAVPGIRAVFDPANFVQSGADPLKAWDMLAEHVEYLHIKDSLDDGRNVPAGEGSGRIPEIIKKYAAAGGRVLTLEPHLWEFAGLSGLEREGEKSKVGGIASSQRAAFDIGVKALKNILENINL